MTHPMTPPTPDEYRGLFKGPFVDDKGLVTPEVFIAFDLARNKALNEDLNDHIGAIIAGLQAVIQEQSRIASAKTAEPTTQTSKQDVNTSEHSRLPTRLEAQQAAQVLMRCNGADLSAWTNDVWPDQSMDEALRALSAPTEEQKAYPLSSFDALPCSTHDCGTMVEPKSVSVKNGEPTVAYNCPKCGRTWRIGPEGNETHAREGRKLLPVGQRSR